MRKKSAWDARNQGFPSLCPRQRCAKVDLSHTTSIDAKASSIESTFRGFYGAFYQFGVCPPSKPRWNNGFHLPEMLHHGANFMLGSGFGNRGDDAYLRS